MVDSMVLENTTKKKRRLQTGSSNRGKELFRAVTALCHLQEMQRHLGAGPALYPRRGGIPLG